jgi:hypothetical protein
MAEPQKLIDLFDLLGVPSVPFPTESRLPPNGVNVRSAKQTLIDKAHNWSATARRRTSYSPRTV